MQHVILNGELIQRELAKIPVSDHLVLSGEALRVSFRVQGSIPLQLTRHTDRLATALSSPYIALPFAVSERKLGRDVARLCGADKLYDAFAHYIISPGEDTELFADFVNPPRVTTLLYLEPLDDYLKLSQNGVRLWVSPFKRVRGDLSVIFPYGDSGRQVQRMAVREGFDAAVITDESGSFLNATCGNIFAVVDGALITPHPQKDGVYPGVVREVVLSEAAKLGMVVYQESLTPEVLAKASEMFVTSSALELAFVREVGGRVFKEFPLTAKLLLNCRQRIASEKPAV